MKNILSIILFFVVSISFGQKPENLVPPVDADGTPLCQNAFVYYSGSPNSVGAWAFEECDVDGNTTIKDCKSGATLAVVPFCGPSETVTTLVDNGDGSFSYTNEVGTVTTYSTAIEIIPDTVGVEVIYKVYDSGGNLVDTSGVETLDCKQVIELGLDMCSIITSEDHPFACLDCDGGGVDNWTECQNGTDPTQESDDYSVSTTDVDSLRMNCECFIDDLSNYSTECNQGLTTYSLLPINGVELENLGAGLVEICFDQELCSQGIDATFQYTAYCENGTSSTSTYDIMFPDCALQCSPDVYVTILGTSAIFRPLENDDLICTDGTTPDIIVESLTPTTPPSYVENLGDGYILFSAGTTGEIEVEYRVACGGISCDQVCTMTFNVVAGSPMNDFWFTPNDTPLNGNSVIDDVTCTDQNPANYNWIDSNGDPTTTPPTLDFGTITGTVDNWTYTPVANTCVQISIPYVGPCGIAYIVINTSGCIVTNNDFLNAGTATTATITVSSNDACVNSTSSYTLLDSQLNPVTSFPSELSICDANGCPLTGVGATYDINDVAIVGFDPLTGEVDIEIFDLTIYDEDHELNVCFNYEHSCLDPDGNVVDGPEMVCGQVKFLETYAEARHEWGTPNALGVISTTSQSYIKQPSGALIDCGEQFRYEHIVDGNVWETITGTLCGNDYISDRTDGLSITDFGFTGDFGNGLNFGFNISNWNIAILNSLGEKCENCEYISASTIGGQTGTLTLLSSNNGVNHYEYVNSHPSEGVSSTYDVYESQGINNQGLPMVRTVGASSMTWDRGDVRVVLRESIIPENYCDLYCYNVFISDIDIGINNPNPNVPHHYIRNDGNDPSTCPELVPVITNVTQYQSDRYAATTNGGNGIIRWFIPDGNIDFTHVNENISTGGDLVALGTLLRKRVVRCFDGFESRNYVGGQGSTNCPIESTNQDNNSAYN